MYLMSRNRVTDQIMTDVKVDVGPCGPRYVRIEKGQYLTPGPYYAQGNQKIVWKVHRFQKNPKQFTVEPLVWICPKLDYPAQGYDPVWTSWKRELYFAPWMGSQDLGPIVLKSGPDYMIVQKLDGDVTQLAHRQARQYMADHPGKFPSNHGPKNTLLLTRKQIRQLFTLVDKISRLGIVLGDLKIDNIGYFIDADDPTNYHFRIYDFGFTGFETNHGRLRDESSSSLLPYFGWSFIYGCDAHRPIPDTLRPYANILQLVQSLDTIVPFLYIQEDDGKQGLSLWTSESVDSLLPQTSHAWKEFYRACPQIHPLPSDQQQFTDQLANMKVFRQNTRKFFLPFEFQANDHKFLPGEKVSETQPIVIPRFDPSFPQIEQLLPALPRRGGTLVIPIFHMSMYPDRNVR